MQSAAKHMAKKNDGQVMHARCVATVLLNLIIISMLPSERKKISSKFWLKTQTKVHVNKTVIFMKENVGNCFTKVKIKAVLLRCCLLYASVVHNSLICCHLQFDSIKRGLCPRLTYM